MKLAGNKYLVSLSNNQVTIGCKQFNASEVLTSLLAIINQSLLSHGNITKHGNNVIYENMGEISIEDAKLLIKFLQDSGVKCES